MKKEEFIKIYNEIGLDSAIGELADNQDYIVSREVLLDFAVNQIYDGNISFAVHILNAVDEEYAEWYRYDFSMGKLETPTAITSVEDIEDLLEGE